MKIAIICSSFFPVIDGVTIAVHQRLKQLSLLGHQVIVFCPDYSAIEHIYLDYQQYQGNILPGVEIVSLPSTKAIALDFERDVTVKSYQIVLKRLAQFKPDIIHVDEAERLGFCWLNLPGVKYAKQHNIPCVAWYHTNYLDYLDDYLHLPLGINKLVKQFLKQVFAKIYNSYDATLVSSSVTEERVKQLGIKNTLYAELLGCDLVRFDLVTKTADYFSQQYHLPNLDSKIKLIYIGRLTADKGWDFALQSFAKLPPKLLDKIAIIIIGDGYLRAEIEHSLKQLTPDVYLLGRIEPTAIPELLFNGDIFITNSTKETRGLTVIEAAAAGIPTIAPKAGGVIDTILDCETGLLYTPQDIADFIDKLTLLISDYAPRLHSNGCTLRDRHLRQSMGVKAKKQAQQYSWEITVNNLIKIWSQEIKKKHM